MHIKHIAGLDEMYTRYTTKNTDNVFFDIFDIVIVRDLSEIVNSAGNV